MFRSELLHLGRALTLKAPFRQGPPPPGGLFCSEKSRGQGEQGENRARGKEEGPRMTTFTERRCECPGAAITKDHKPAAWTIEIYSPEGRCLQLRCGQGLKGGSARVPLPAPGVAGGATTPVCASIGAWTSPMPLLIRPLDILDEAPTPLQQDLI